jgi:hypothetical protein
MRKTMKNLNRFPRGSTLAMVMAVMVLLFITGVGILAVGFQSRLLAIADKESLAARCAADAGIEHAIFLVNQSLKAGTLNDASLPSASNVALQPATANESYSYMVTGSWPNYTLTATGKYGQRTKTMSALLRPIGVFEYAMLVATTLTTQNNDIIKAPNTSVPLMVGTLSSAAGAITMNNNSAIQGDAFVGVGGNASTGIDATVTGRKFVKDDPPLSMHTPIVPASALSASPNTAWVTPNNASIGAAGTTTYLRYTDITINGALNIVGNVILYVNGNITDSGSGINVTSNSSLTLYITGNLTGGNGVWLGSASGDPSTLTIYGVGASPQTFTLSKNNGTMVGRIYAPNAFVDAKNMNTGSFTGSIVANSFQAKNNATFIYDQRVRNYDKTSPDVKLVVKGWSE